jgi:hypothetical protein
MAVAASAKTATVTNVSGVSTLTINNTTGNITVAPGDSALEVMIWFASATFPTITKVNWDDTGTPQAMTQVPGTQIADGGSSTSGAKYALLAPTSGNKSLVISWSSGALEAHAIAQSYTGVNQTSVAVAFPNGTTNHGVTALATITISSAVGNIASAFHNQGAGAYGTVSGTTIAKDDTTGPAIGVVGNFVAGNTPNVTLTAAQPSTAWASFGSDILAAAGGGPVTPSSTSRLLMGVGI